MKNWKLSKNDQVLAYRRPAEIAMEINSKIDKNFLDTCRVLECSRCAIRTVCSNLFGSPYDYKKRDEVRFKFLFMEDSSE